MNKAMKTLVAILALGAAAFFVYRFVSAPSTNDLDIAGGTWYICDDEKCRHEFNLTRSEMRSMQKANKGQVVCPKCNGMSCSEAYQCRFCKRALPPVGHGFEPEKCKHCGQTLNDANPEAEKNDPPQPKGDAEKK